MIGAEANCTYRYCCRANSNLDPNWTSRPAPRYGSFLWYVVHTEHNTALIFYSDAPYPLITATFRAIPVLAGIENSSFNFSIYTGDLVSHDLLNELSRYADGMLCSRRVISIHTVESTRYILRLGTLVTSGARLLTSTQTVLFDLMKRMINTGPVYAVPGNHDTYQSYVYLFIAS